MSIPLDHLYYHLENLCGEDVIIYRWTPHGSKNLEDLIPIGYLDIESHLTMPIIIAHDQEPLDYDHFENQGSARSKFLEWDAFESHNEFMKSISKLRIQTGFWNIHDKILLCHSEKNSEELSKFDSDFIGVYYWSHALIARDWFRFAEHDTSLINSPQRYKHDFLIYNRAWTGTREYRLKFVELLVNAGLADKSNIKFSAVDSGVHYTTHKFKNPVFEIVDHSIEDKILPNMFDSTASAKYVSNDYNTCGIEIVLETLFDDKRNHLTEKTLRPIACGKPFMIASTPGSLEYLRTYGFKTFNEFIDESYDLVQDPVARLNCIVQEMSRIHALPINDKLKIFHELNNIANYNQTLFFSKEWHQQISNEFKTNVGVALTQLKQYKNATTWTNLRSIVVENRNMEKIFTGVFGQGAIGLLDDLIQINS